MTPLILNCCVTYVIKLHKPNSYAICAMRFRAWFTVEKNGFGVAGKETTIGILRSSSLVMKRKRLLISH